MFKSLRVALFLAPKSIVRGNLGISVLTICMLAIVSMDLLFIPGLINGIVDGSNTQLINTYSGDMIIESKKDPYIDHVSGLISQIKDIPGVAALSARNTVGAKIEHLDQRMNINIYAINPVEDAKVFAISKYLIEGQYLEQNDRNQILLGIQIAGADRENIELYSSSLHNVHTGDNVTVTYSNGVKRVYAVKGIFYTRFLQTDVQAFISNIDYQAIITGQVDTATIIHLKLNKNADFPDVKSRILNLNDGLKIKTWTEMAGIIRSMTDSFKIIRQILDVINILIAGITVFIVTYVDVVNRKRQIGIQRAIGIKTRSITMSYIFRALFYAFVGLIVGCLVYTYIIIPIETQHPFTFPIGPAYLNFDPLQLARTVVILLLVSIVASFIPVFRVMRKTILDAIWG